MNKNEAIVTLLGNFAYFDGQIKAKEVEKIKAIGKKRSITDNIDSIISKNVKNKENNIKMFAESMVVLNRELSEKEKLSLIADIVDLIKADGKVDEVEKYKVSMLAVNWDITIKERVFK